MKLTLQKLQKSKILNAGLNIMQPSKQIFFLADLCKQVQLSDLG